MDSLNTTSTIYQMLHDPPVTVHFHCHGTCCGLADLGSDRENAKTLWIGFLIIVGEMRSEISDQHFIVWRKRNGSLMSALGMTDLPMNSPPLWIMINHRD
jgi:hypothetical protein